MKNYVVWMTMCRLQNFLSFKVDKKNFVSKYFEIVFLKQKKQCVSKIHFFVLRF